MQIKLIFDGGGNKTMEAYGSFQITYDDNGDPVEIVSRETFGTGFTNNEAEYKTFISALEYLLNHLDRAGIAPFDVELTILGDSDLVRKQVGTYAREADTYVWSGWKVNKLHLLPYRDHARKLLENFASFVYDHVPREYIVKVLGH